MNKENIITQIKKNSNEVYRISEKEYEGYRFIDVRIYYQDRKTQEWKPTTKGISIMPDKVEDVVNGILKAMEIKAGRTINRSSYKPSRRRYVYVEEDILLFNQRTVYAD